MTLVKICGIKRKEDIVIVNTYLPDYIGFVFAKSKRQVNCSEVQELSKDLNKSIKKVGVFVNEDIDTVIEIAGKCGLHAVQIHGDETPIYSDMLKHRLNKKNYWHMSATVGSCHFMPIAIWKAIRVKDSGSLDLLKDFNADAFVLDTYTVDGYGGSGKTFDWNLAYAAQIQIAAQKQKKIILAGGLTIQNVQNAIKCASPFAVDVSSGVETEGCKDEVKIKDFINTVREMKAAGREQNDY